MIKPAKAIVRPRVSGREISNARLLEEVIAELAEESEHKVVWIVGDPGSGRTTALAHLAAVFTDDDRLVFLDEPRPSQVERKTRMVVATADSVRRGGGVVLRIQAWGTDELVEYLLAVDKTACDSVISRLESERQRKWLPQVARIVLKQFLHDALLTDSNAALLREIHDLLPKPKQIAVAAEFCLEVLVGNSESVLSGAKTLTKRGCPDGIFSLLCHRDFQLPLVAEHLVSLLSSRKSCKMLSRRLPVELVDLVGDQCREKPSARRRLDKLILTRRSREVHPMVASFLLRVDPTWRPDARCSARANLQGGYLAGAVWPEIDLSQAALSSCDFSGANLLAATLERAIATGACFDGCELSGALLSGAIAPASSFRNTHLQKGHVANAGLQRADFTAADLSECRFNNSTLTEADLRSARAPGAYFRGARLVGAKLDGCDFSGANFYTADLSHADLRRCKLEGANFKRSILKGAMLEDITLADAQFSGAQLAGAHLTGSKLPTADFYEASLAGAHLAEIEWEAADLREADLRGATFHMGSSRSGLVGSPIACEGSKTGFYTDDREEMYFKRPEEIRKANLCGADLRGARIDGVDFYLVDLRDARMDSNQLFHVRRCGAILSEEG